MAYRFTLAIECGPDPDAASACIAHFKGHSTQGPASAITWQAHHHVLIDEGSPAHWVEVYSLDLPAHGMSRPSDNPDLAAAQDAILHRLQSAPPFRLAILGIEALAAIAYTELQQQGPDPRFLKAFAGMVFQKGIIPWDQTLPTWRPGYVQIPFDGQAQA